MTRHRFDCLSKYSRAHLISAIERKTPIPWWKEVNVIVEQPKILNLLLASNNMAAIF